MKILKKGNEESDLWVGKCVNCKAIVEVTESELTHIAIGDYRSDNGDYSWEECKTCGGIVPTICFHKVDTKSGQRVLSEV